MTNPDKPEPKRNRLVREITNYKSQITNKSQFQNYKSQKKLRPSDGFLNAFGENSRDARYCVSIPFTLHQSTNNFTQLLNQPKRCHEDIYEHSSLRSQFIGVMG